VPTGSGTRPADSLAIPFFAQVGVTPSTCPADAVTALRSAGDAMLAAIVYARG
jgi:glucoamylase